MVTISAILVNLFGPDVSDEVADLQACQRSGPRGPKLRHDQSAQLIIGLDRFANLGRRIGHSESESRHPSVLPSRQGRIGGRVGQPGNLQCKRLLLARSHDREYHQRIRRKPRRNLTQILESHRSGADAEQDVSDQ